MERSRGDTRGREVGRFFWQRVAMRTRNYAKAEQKTHIQYVSDAVKAASDTWRVSPGQRTRPNAFSQGSDYFVPRTRSRMAELEMRNGLAFSDYSGSPTLNRRGASPSSVTSPVDRFRDSGIPTRASRSNFLSAS